MNLMPSAAINERLASLPQVAAVSLQQAVILLVLSLVWSVAQALKWVGKPLL